MWLSGDFFYLRKTEASPRLIVLTKTHLVIISVLFQNETQDFASDPDKLDQSEHSCSKTN